MSPLRILFSESDPPGYAEFAIYYPAPPPPSSRRTSRNIVVTFER
jgi:hypothetical protein